MATSDSAFRFENFNGFSAVSLLPELNKVPWADIDGIGSTLVERLEARSPPVFLVDLSALNYMGSAMVALVVRLWKSVKERNGKMAVVNTDPSVLEVLTLAGLAKVWRIVPTREEGIKALGISDRQMRAEGFTPAAASADEKSATLPAVLTAVLLLVAAAGLFLLLNPQDFANDQRLVMGLLFGGSIPALIAATATATLGAGWKRGFGVLALLGALGIGSAGVAKTPELKGLFTAEAKDDKANDDSAVAGIGNSPKDGNAPSDANNDGPAVARKPASLKPAPDNGLPGRPTSGSISPKAPAPKKKSSGASLPAPPKAAGVGASSSKKITAPPKGGQPKAPNGKGSSSGKTPLPKPPESTDG